MSSELATVRDGSGAERERQWRGARSMNHFLYKLIPPRPSFPADMFEAEGAIMQAHFGYWAG
jgi:hypothetical protein